MSNSNEHDHGKTDDENASRPQPRWQGDASGAEPRARPQEQVNADAQYETAAGAQAPSSPETVTTPPASEAEVTFSENAEATNSATSPGVVLPDAATLSAPAALSAIGPADAGSSHHIGDSKTLNLSDDLGHLLLASAEDTLLVDPAAEQRRRNRLTTEHQRLVKLVREQSERRDRGAAKLAEAQEAIVQAIRAKINAEIAVTSYTEQIGNAERHKAGLEAELQKVDVELADLARTPQERAAYRARRENAARKAAEAAAHEAWLDELVPVERPYMRIEPGRFDRDQSRKWKPRLVSDVTIYSVKRRDVEKHTAEMVEAAAWIAEQRRLEERNELAAEYEDELRTNGRRTFFRTARERVEYFSAWGQDSPRGRAYRERQRERGRSEADPAKTPSGGYFIAPGGGLAGWR